MMTKITTTLAAAPVLLRVLDTVSSASRARFGGGLRWHLFVAGYGLLGACTAQSVVDAWAGNGTLLPLGFIAASALLILGDRRRHMPKKGGGNEQLCQGHALRRPMGRRQSGRSN